ncbi:MAG: ABC-F family ATP-binding cassette domain-containing protein [Pseudomonadota bacterium]
MIHIQQIDLQRDTKIIFSKANLLINPYEKIGLIGPNGSGKTSLFLLLQKQLEPDQGEIHIGSQSSLSHMQQSIPNSELSILDYTMQGHKIITQLKADLAKAELANDGLLIAELHQQLLQQDAYSLEAKSAIILTGLGFANTDLTKSVNSFSGGWRMRLNLAQVLLADADIILLDEPTNHLDLEAIYWLENYLNSIHKTLVIISHDREFLDKIVSHTVCINDCKLTKYSGNFSAYEKAMLEQQAIQAAAYKKQQATLKHMQKFIDRFRYKPSKAKQVQSRVKMLNKIQMVAKLHEQSLFSFVLQAGKLTGNPVLAVKNMQIHYADFCVLQKLNLTLNTGDRIGLIGPNGAGKTTFLKMLANKHTQFQGDIVKNKNLKIAYFAQDQIEILAKYATPFLHMQALDSKLTEAEIRRYLGSFNFIGDAVFKSVESFSGGEKARLVLALLCWDKPNLLLMDEPTNHLDMEMRDALNLVLQNFSGAIVIVSHDRFLLKSVVDEFWLVADKTVKRFNGDLTDYLHWFNERLASNKISATTKTSQKPRANKQQSTYQIERLEKTLDKKLLDKKQLEQKIAAYYAATTQVESDIDKWLKQINELNEIIRQLEDEILAKMSE